MNTREGERRLKVARKHLERARKATAEGDPEEFIIWAFYAYESAVAAGAKAAGISFNEKNHREKASVARKLGELKIVSRDIADELADLNALRKNVQYDDPDFSDDEFDEPEDLEDKLALLEKYIDEISAHIDTLRKKNDKNHKSK